jgi:hypothetical protein
MNDLGNQSLPRTLNPEVDRYIEIMPPQFSLGIVLLQSL